MVTSIMIFPGIIILDIDLFKMINDTMHSPRDLKLPRD